MLCRAFVCFLACVFGVAAAEPDADWPQWHGPNRASVWSNSKLPTTFPEAGPPVRWRRPIGGGYGGIAVVGKRVYVMDRQTKPAEVERVLCLDFDTGEPIWVHQYPVNYKGVDYGNGPRSTPTVHDSKVYTFGAKANLFCLDAITGKVIWQHDGVAEFKSKIPMWGHAGSPLIDGEKVFVQMGGEDACLMAFDRTTGKVLWRSLTDEPGYSSPVRIDVGKQKLVVMWTPEHVHGVDAETGERLWSVPHKVTYGVSIVDPVWHDGVLFVSEYWNGSIALQLDERGRNPKVLWNGKRLRMLMATALARDGHAYCLDRENGLVCVELRSGKIKWDGCRISYDKRNPHAPLTWTADGRMLALNEKGELIQLKVSPEKFEELSRTRLFAGSWAHPAFAKNCIIVREEKADGEIICLQLVP